VLPALLATLVSGSLAAQAVGSEQADTGRLIALVESVQEADYRGDLPRLLALVGELEPFTRQPGVARAAYHWRGFAYWRRALNGANESNADFHKIEQDFAAATREFRQALETDSTYVEAQIGAAAGLMSRGYLRRRDSAQAKEHWREAQVLLDAVERRDPHNPRLLFITAGRVFWTPTQYGGDQQRAIEMVERGLERESGTPRTVARLEPAWGKAELHMLAAFFHANRASPDLASAERHARMALAAHPEWHYVRDILLPQIAARRKRSPS
jgi:tetratricopeptide (TPR) repeat protein